MDVLKFLSKWLHLLSITGMLGSLLFSWLVLLPVMRRHAIEEDEPSRAMWRAYGITLGVLWMVILLTGFYNLFVISASVNKVYHTVLGAKIALALLMFGLSMALFHPAPAFAHFRRNRPQWMLTLVVLGAIVVGLSAHLNLSRLSGAALERPAAANPP